MGTPVWPVRRRVPFTGQSSVEFADTGRVRGGLVHFNLAIREPGSQRLQACFHEIGGAGYFQSGQSVKEVTAIAGIRVDWLGPPPRRKELTDLYDPFESCFMLPLRGRDARGSHRVSVDIEPAPLDD